MFCVIYEFEVTPENEQEFKQIWHQLTLIIKDTKGALGSRLHKDLTRHNNWIAYAQWPNRENWFHPDTKMSELQIKLRERMNTVCAKINTIYELEVVDDLLVH